MRPFEFLIGKWRCEAKALLPDGKWQTLEATWEGRFILEGRVIADEYRMTGPGGETLVLGVNLRAYDAARKIWNIKWLDALTGTWLELGPPELGGITFHGQSITYTNISENHFTLAR